MHLYESAQILKFLSLLPRLAHCLLLRRPQIDRPHRRRGSRTLGGRMEQRSMRLLQGFVGSPTAQKLCRLCRRRHLVSSTPLDGAAREAALLAPPVRPFPWPEVHEHVDQIRATAAQRCRPAVLSWEWSGAFVRDRWPRVARSHVGGGWLERSTVGSPGVTRQRADS